MLQKSGQTYGVFIKLVLKHFWNPQFILLNHKLKLLIYQRLKKIFRLLNRQWFKAVRRYEATKKREKHLILLSLLIVICTLYIKQMKKEIFAGLGLGVLIGTIIGLSIAEVTGIILGALTSLLAAFFGLRSEKNGETGNQVRIGTFSFTCLLSIFMGLFIRSHNLLSPSLENEINDYRMAFFDTSEIKKIILFKQFGLIPQELSFSKEAARLNRNSVLMASETKSLFLCNDIDANSSLDDIRKSFDNTSSKLSELEKTLSNQLRDTVILRNILLSVKNALCE
jgi:hypothetical protein